MSKPPVLAAGTCLLFLLLCPAVIAAAADGPKAKLFAKYDTNKNGVIDGDEIATLRKDFAADPEGPLARFDTNHDGKLSDEEIAAIKPPGKGTKKGHKSAEKSGSNPAND